MFTLDQWRHDRSPPSEAKAVRLANAKQKRTSRLRRCLRIAASRSCPESTLGELPLHFFVSHRRWSQLVTAAPMLTSRPAAATGKRGTPPVTGRACVLTPSCPWRPTPRILARKEARIMTRQFSVTTSFNLDTQSTRPHFDVLSGRYTKKEQIPPLASIHKRQDK
jgi:hypothetical protein